MAGEATYAHAYARAHARIRARAHARTHAHVHAHAHGYAHAHAHAHRCGYQWDAFPPNASFGPGRPVSNGAWYRGSEVRCFECLTLMVEIDPLRILVLAYLPALTCPYLPLPALLPAYLLTHRHTA